MALESDLEISVDLLNVVKQIPDEQEAMEVWCEITQWAAEFYRQTGELATLDDLYREWPTMLPDEEYELDDV